MSVAPSVISNSTASVRAEEHHQAQWLVVGGQLNRLDDAGDQIDTLDDIGADIEDLKAGETNHPDNITINDDGSLSFDLGHQLGSRDID